MKNKQPFLVEVPLLVPSILWKEPQTIHDIIIVIQSLTYEVYGNLRVLRTFL
jgi:hypothetical protein